MTFEQQLLKRLQEVPPRRHKELLAFVDSLSESGRSAMPRSSMRGLWKDLDIEIGDKDILESRREMWGNFPREVS